MKIQIISDIHFDVDKVRTELLLANEADVLIVAGDVAEGAKESFEWLRNRFGPDIPIVTVAGNHTFYRRQLPEELQLARELAPSYQIHFLEDSSVEIAGVLFAGGALWTDYCLMGEEFRAYAMREAALKMMDHKCITWSKQPWARFHPKNAAAMHAKSMRYLGSVADKDFSGKKVFVTHHAPSILSLATHHRDDLLSAAYASSLEKFILENGPHLWIHGHAHSSSDYQIGETRVVCNPHGYGLENAGFQPRLVIEV
jgi:Icc-related predicted phosphoesterase